ncbi:hypothetical protein BC829DRAFT_150352 [Chytridium lagenaria]|nr:hypothetical protein BC829DRAFT_150352 [Chytridium lagenaria]
MSLFLVLIGFFKPLHECTKMALFRSGIITASCFCFLVVLKFLFQGLVVDRREGSQVLPFREEAVIFGVCTYLSFRALVNNLGLARRRPVWLLSTIPPLAAYIILGILFYVTISLIWLRFPGTFETALTFAGEIIFPVSYVFSLFLTNLALAVNTKTLASVLIYLIVVLMLQTVMFLELSIGVICLVITNIRNEGYLINLKKYDNGGSVSIDQQLLTGFLVAAIYPLLKYAVTFLNQKTFSFAAPPIPRNRIEEIASNTTLFTVVTG